MTGVGTPAAAVRAEERPPAATAHTLFATAIGDCAIAWRMDVVTGVLLPSRTLASHIRRCWPGSVPAEPPPPVARAIDDVVALLSGEPRDLRDVAVDLTGVPPLSRQVYELARTIPPGQTLTYGEVAARIGLPGAAQAVGQALGRNPVPIVVPCHRIVAAGGRSGGFSASGGATTKLRILRIEGAAAGGPPTLFD